MFLWIFVPVHPNGGNATSTSGLSIPVDTVDVNVGNHMNGSSGVNFTAPDCW